MAGIPATQLTCENSTIHEQNYILLLEGSCEMKLLERRNDADFHSTFTFCKSNAQAMIKWLEKIT